MVRSSVWGGAIYQLSVRTINFWRNGGSGGEVFLKKGVPIRMSTSSGLDATVCQIPVKNASTASNTSSPSPNDTGTHSWLQQHEASRGMGSGAYPRFLPSLNVNDPCPSSLPPPAPGTALNQHQLHRVLATLLLNSASCVPRTRGRSKGRGPQTMGRVRQLKGKV